MANTETTPSAVGTPTQPNQSNPGTVGNYDITGTNSDVASSAPYGVNPATGVPYGGPNSNNAAPAPGVSSPGVAATRYAPSDSATEGTASPGGNYVPPGADPNAVDLADTQNQMSTLFAQQIAGIQSAYQQSLATQTDSQNKVNAENQGEAESAAAMGGVSAGGQGGIQTVSQAGQDALNDIQNTLSEQEEQQEESVFGAQEGDAEANEQQELTASLDSYKTKTAGIVSSLQTMAASGMNIGTIDSATMNNILQATGWTPQEFSTVYGAYQTAASKPNTQVLTAADGTMWMISQNPTTGAVISSQNLGLPAGTVSIPQGGAVYDPSTNTIVAQGQSKPTSIPVAGTAAYDAPASAAGGTAATAPSGGGTTGSTGATAPTTPALPGATGGGNATGGQGSSAAITDPATGGPVSWATLGISDPSAVKVLTSLNQTPQTIYMQAWAAITGSATDTTTASGGSGSGSGAAIGRIMNGAVAQAQASIMKAYGLTPADLPAIAAIAGGTTTALESAIPQQSTIQQYISKTSANLTTLQGAIANYSGGQSPIVNEALQALQKNVTGNPQYAALNTALVPFLSEYAKVMQGSTGSVSGATVNSQQEAAGLLQTQMNSGSFQAAISVMLSDMAGQVNSKNAQVMELTQNLGDVVQQYSEDKGNSVNVPQNNPQQFTVNGQSYYVGDAIPVTDQSGNTTLYQIEADGSLNPY